MSHDDDGDRSAMARSKRTYVVALLAVALGATMAFMVAKQAGSPTPVAAENCEAVSVAPVSVVDQSAALTDEELVARAHRQMEADKKRSKSAPVVQTIAEEDRVKHCQYDPDPKVVWGPGGTPVVTTPERLPSSSGPTAPPTTNR